MIGKSFSNYSIVDKIGEGGMGEVYRAQDSKLKRDVAVKVLPSTLLEDPERLARFEREAQLLASLNHPNIAAVYGLEETEGHHCLIMELVEGEDLAVALQRGPIAPDTVTSIAKQVAEALEAAHESGIIHRDLKPANILMRPDGQVKVLDFGLAKAIEGDPAESNPALTQSPTLTGMMTGANVILGTASYMSPEQARGQQVDKRTDIWAYGVVLFELLTGQQTFDGGTVSDVLASVLKSDPDLDTLPADTPSHLRKLIDRCLVKDPKQRLRDIGEARILLEAGETSSDEPQSVAAPEPAKRWGVPPWMVGALAVLAIAATGLAWMLKPSPPAETVHGAILLPEHQQLMLFSGGHMAFSPDGRRLAFAAQDTLGNSSLWIRNLADAASHELSGTNGAVNPFWSPDGSQLGFFADGQLKRVPVDGGAPLTLCPAPRGRGGSWRADGTIVFSPNYNAPLQTIDALGGTPVAHTELAQGQFSHRWPQAVDGGLLYSNLGNVDEIFFQPDGDSARALLAASSQAEFTDGFLHYLIDGVLFARPFDPATGKFTGEPRTVTTDVLRSEGYARGAFTLAPAGRLAYVSGTAEESQSHLIQFGRTGETLAAHDDLGTIRDLALSLDGRRLAYSLIDVDTSEFDIWVFEVGRTVQTRVSSGGRADDPVWSPDGTRIAYAESSGVRIIAASGVGEPDVISDPGDGDDCMHDWSRDGRYLLWSRATPDQDRPALWVHDLTTGESREFLREAWQGQFSPDGNWIAYTSPRSGNLEIYLQDFPGLTDRWQITVSGGDSPRWLGDGTGIVHLTADRTMTETPITFSGGKPSIGQPKALFPTELERDRSIQISVSDDGSSIWALETPLTQGRADPIRFVLNWPGNQRQ